MGSSNLTVAAEWNTIDTFSVTVLTSSFDNPKLGSKISPVIGINFATCSGFLTFQSWNIGVSSITFSLSTGMIPFFGRISKYILRKEDFDYSQKYTKIE